MVYDPVMAALNAAQPGKQESPACTTGSTYVRYVCKPPPLIATLGQHTTVYYRDVVKGIQAGLGDDFTINLPGVLV